MENEDIILIDSIETLKEKIKDINKSINNRISITQEINEEKIINIENQSNRNNKTIKDILQLFENQNKIITNLEKEIITLKKLKYNEDLNYDPSFCRKCK